MKIPQTDKDLTYNPALEKGIDYITSAVRALKAQFVNLKIHRHPDGQGSVSIDLEYVTPAALKPISAPDADTHDPGD